MNTPVSSGSLACAAGWLKARPFTLLGGVLLLIAAIPFCRRHDSEWEQVYMPAAAHLCKGEDMYRMRDGYLYPPFMAATALPFLVLPAPLPRLVWFAINVLSLLLLLRWGWRLAGGGRFEPMQNAECRMQKERQRHSAFCILHSAFCIDKERLAALLGCLCGISYVENCLAHQQTDIVIAAVLVGGCLLLWRGRPLAAATAFGVAAACKCTALLWAPYLLWRGRPLAAVWLLTVAVGVNLTPDVVHAPPAGRSWLEQYISRFLKPLTASDHYIGTWASDPVYNQSLTGLGQRWCTTRWKWMPSDCTIEPRLPLLRPQSLRFWVYGVELTLLAAVLCICGRPFRPLRDEADGSRQTLECAIVLLLMVLLSPMSSKAHFATLVVPGFCLARAAVHSPSRLLKGVLLAAAVFLGLLCNKDPLGERLYTLSLWYGVVTWQTLLLLAGCLLIYRGPSSAFRAPPKPIADNGHMRALFSLFSDRRYGGRAAS